VSDAPWRQARARARSAQRVGIPCCHLRRARVGVGPPRAQIMFNLEKAHFILEEMVMNGSILEANKANILKPIALMEKASEENLFKR
jgi:hypothetical protein